MAPHLHDVLSHSGSNRYRVVLRPLYQLVLDDELSRLNTAQLCRLRPLVAVQLKKDREYLRQLYAEMRRFPRSMKAGYYGENLTELVNEVMEKALKDIDERLPARSNGGDWDVPF